MPHPMPDLVVLIPGIGGSVLQRHGKTVWAPRPGAALRAALSLGRSIGDLALDGDDPALDHLDDGVTAPALVPDLHIVPGLDWKIDGYTRLRRALFERYDLEEGRNYLEFPYDWRRDTRVAARNLERVVRPALKAWRERSGNPEARLILVGHSMGGIVSRIFLEFHDGWNITRRLVTFGTPYSGSINALEFLSNGFRKAWGLIDLSSMLRSFTSVYQLLPSYRCLDVGGGVEAPGRGRRDSQRGPDAAGGCAPPPPGPAAGGGGRRGAADALRHPPHRWETRSGRSGAPG